MRPNAMVAGAVLALMIAGVVFVFLADGPGRQGRQSLIGTAALNGISGPGLAVVPPQGTPAMPIFSQSSMVPAAASLADDVVPNYVPKQVELFEAHWQGIDSRLLTAELRQKLKYPRGLIGVLIGEATLNAVEAGLLAGDVIVEIEGTPVATLEEFQRQTRRVRNQPQAGISVLRKGPEKEQGRYTMQRLTLVLRATPDLGMAQVEGAPQIQPGSPRPHGNRGVCTRCHAIGTGLELTPDPDLITLPSPPISRDVVAKGILPHENRGPCEACHIIR